MELLTLQTSQLSCIVGICTALYFGAQGLMSIRITNHGTVLPSDSFYVLPTNSKSVVN